MKPKIAIGDEPSERQERGYNSEWLDALLDAAKKNKGKWVSSDIPKGTTSSNARFRLAGKKRLWMERFDMAVRDGRLYLMILKG